MDENSRSDPEGGENTESVPRARNRTVMLTPDITGQVRARMAQQESPAANREPAGPRRPSETPIGLPAAGPSREAAIVVPPARPRPTAGSGSSIPASRPGGGREPEAPAPPQAAAARPGVHWLKLTPVVGFLVSFDKNPNGEIYELRSGRLIISSQPADSSSCLLIDHPSVSPMHAILRISAGGEIQVLDQLSEFGTRIRRFGTDQDQELSGDKGALEHGDVVRFGERSFSVCLLVQGA